MKKGITLALLLILLPQSSEGMNPRKGMNQRKGRSTKKPQALTEEEQMQIALALSSADKPATPNELSKQTQSTNDDLRLALEMSMRIERERKASAVNNNNNNNIQNRRIEGVAIRQLILNPRDAQMSGHTCGPRSLFIAAAFDTLAYNHQGINANTMHDALTRLGYHRAIQSCHQNYEMPSNEFAQFMQANNFHVVNPFILVSYANTQTAIPGGISVEQEADIEHLNTIPDLLRILSNNPNPDEPITFICNIDNNHWVLFSVITQNGIPTVWYVDPMNADIHYNRGVLAQYVRYIRDHAL